MKIITNPIEPLVVKLLQDSKNTVYLVAPYIGPSTMEMILENTNAHTLKILTKIEPEDLSGAITLKSLELLYSKSWPKVRNIEVHVIRNLHAKVFIFDNKFGIITSSNLTNSGLNNNVEVGILLESPEDQKFIEDTLQILNQYWELGEHLSRDSVHEILEKLSRSHIEMIKSAKAKNAITKMSDIPEKSGLKIGPIVPPISQITPKIERPRSKNEILREIASILSQKEMSFEEVINILHEYESKYQFKIFLRDAFKYSFDSENPFETASIYYRNFTKVDKKFKKDFSSNLARMFCNLILGKGTISKYGLEISTPLQYLQYRKFFEQYFKINPPKHKEVIRALDSKLNVIVQNPIYIQRIISIFLPWAIYYDVEQELKELLSHIYDHITMELKKLTKSKKRRNELLEMKENIEWALSFIT